MRGFPEPWQRGELARLKLVQAGVTRDRVSRGVSSPPPGPHYCQYPERSAVSNPRGPRPDPIVIYDNVMLGAAATLCFFRSGEITVPAISAFNERRHLAWGDVAVDRANPPALIKIHLKHSKCDQLGNGVDVVVGRTGTDVCPVTLTLRYVKERGPTAGPFFLRQDGTPLTKAFFVSRVREALLTLGLNPQHYAGHSFRIGGPQRQGFEDSIIQALGRWSSAAFLRYIRTPREHLAAFSRELARPK